MNKTVTIIAIFILCFIQNTYAQYNKTIHVNTVREFYDAINNNTHIIIDAEALDITRERLEKLQFEGNDYVNISNDYWGTTIEKVHNLKISARNQANLFTIDEDDRVISFINCSNITLENLNIYHRTPAEISCFGEVISIENVNGLSVNNCELNGSGTIALDANQSTNILISNSKLYNNTANFIYARSSTNIKLENCDIYENVLSSNGFILISSDIVIENCRFRDNVIKEEFIYTICAAPTFITFRNCTFKNNRELGYWKIIPKISEVPNITLNKNDYKQQCKDAEDGLDYAVDYGEANDAAKEAQTAVATVAAPSIKQTLKEWMEQNHSNKILELKNAGVPSSDIDNYYSQVYDFNNKATDILFNNINLEDNDVVEKIKKIAALYHLESEKNEDWLDELKKLFQFPLYSYWGKTNISHSDIKKEYLNSWSKLYTSYNIINSLTQKSTNFFDVDLDYLYITKKTKKLQSVHSVIRIQFKDGKIVSINPVKE